MRRFRFVRLRERSRLLGLAELEAVTRSLAEGGLAVLPTETGPMLAAVATKIDSVETAFRVKGRSQSAVMHVACCSLEMARRIGVLDERARALMGAFTPGPLTIVVPQTDALPDELVTVNRTVGIRVPDHPGTLQIIAAVGEPLTATSLNAAGGATVELDEESLRELAWPDGEVFVVADDAAVAYDRPSTLARLTGPEIEILREGPISLAEIRVTLGE